LRRSILNLGINGRWYFSTERDLAFEVISDVGGKRVVVDVVKVSCTVLAEWHLETSGVDNLGGLIRLFGGVFSPDGL
jgi:hypothetical protein